MQARSVVQTVSAQTSTFRRVKHCNTANCARKQARSDSDPCGAVCPDLLKVL